MLLQCTMHFLTVTLDFTITSLFHFKQGHNRYHFFLCVFKLVLYTFTLGDVYRLILTVIICLTAC